MNSKKLKVILILSSFSLILLIVVGVLFSQSKQEERYEITGNEAKVLEIENTKITGISHNTTKNSVTTKIKNKSDNTLSNIIINYVELDKDQNKISTKQMPLDVSLKKDEKVLLTIIPQNYTYTIDIIGYNYEANNYDVAVDLKENVTSTVKIVQEENIEKEIGDISEYDILKLYDLKKISDNNYSQYIQNKSQKNLGNIILKVAEVNSNDEYVSVSNISYNSTLKSKELGKVILTTTDKKNTLQIIGYAYDDIENKENIDIDLKTNAAIIVRN